MNREKVAFVRALQGAPASILVAMMMTGSTMLNKDLCLWTGYSDKPVADGLLLLETMSIVQNNGRANGWSICGGPKQLGLFGRPGALLAGTEEVLAEENQQMRTEAEGAALLGLPLIEERQQPPSELESESEIFRVDIINSQAESEIFRVGSDELPMRARSSSSSNPLSFDPLSCDLEEEEREIKKEKERWLVRAGIGKASPKMNELMNCGLELAYVKAHVLEYEWLKEQEDRPARLCVGTLIVRMLDRDPAPEMRCEECQEVKSDCYCDFVCV